MEPKLFAVVLALIAILPLINTATEVADDQNYYFDVIKRRNFGLRIRKHKHMQNIISIELPVRCKGLCINVSNRFIMGIQTKPICIC